MSSRMSSRVRSPAGCPSIVRPALEEMRIRAVRSVQAGESPEVVARSLRINRRTIMAGWRSIGEVAGER